MTSDTSALAPQLREKKRKRPVSYNPIEALQGLQEDCMRNKGEQTGTLRNRAGSWHIQFSAWVQEDNGRLVYKRLSRRVGPSVGPDRLTKAEAKSKAYREHVAPANGPAAVPQGYATVQQFVDVRFRPDHIASLKTKGGRDHYETILRCHVLPAIGHVAMREVTRGLIQGIIMAKTGAGCSSQVIHHIRNVISSIFRHARILGIHAGPLPVEDVKLPTLRNAERKALTWEEVERLARECGPQYGALVRLIAATGLRIGEACALRWGSVHIGEPSFLVVKESFTRSRFEAVKGDKGGDIVPLTAAAVGALRSIVRRGPDELVFFNSAGSPLDSPNVLNRYIKPAAQRVGLEDVTFHALRHTAATHAERAGISPEARQKFLRHSDRRTTARYTHPEASAFVAALDAVQETERVQ